MAKIDLKKLEKLDPKIRVKVEASLAEALDREIELASGGEPAAATHSRSRGAIFSRSRTSDAFSAAGDLDATILSKVEEMDDSSFEKFTSRLASLKAVGK